RFVPRHSLVAVKVACPKCGYEEPESATECSRCGIVFGKWSPSPGAARHPLPRGEGSDPDDVPDGRLGPTELKVLGIGLVAAIIANAIPFVRFILSAIITLFHALGHALM